MRSLVPLNDRAYALSNSIGADSGVTVVPVAVAVSSAVLESTTGADGDASSSFQ